MLSLIDSSWSLPLMTSQEATNLNFEFHILIGTFLYIYIFQDLSLTGTVSLRR